LAQHLWGTQSCIIWSNIRHTPSFTLWCMPRPHCVAQIRPYPLSKKSPMAVLIVQHPRHGILTEVENRWCPVVEEVALTRWHADTLGSRQPPRFDPQEEGDQILTRSDPGNTVPGASRPVDPVHHRGGRGDAALGGSLPMRRGRLGRKSITGGSSSYSEGKAEGDGFVLDPTREQIAVTARGTDGADSKRSLPDGVYVLRLTREGEAEWSAAAQGPKLDWLSE